MAGVDEEFKIVTHEGKIVARTQQNTYEFSIKDSDVTHVLVTPNHTASEDVSVFEEEARKLARERLDGKIRTELTALRRAHARSERGSGRAKALGRGSMA